MPGIKRETYLLIWLMFWAGSCSKDETPVIIATLEIRDITTSSAVSGGKIVYGELPEIQEKGVVWGISNDPTIENNSGIIFFNKMEQEFYSEIRNLEPETVYYIRAFARNRSGSFYGDERSFKTYKGTVLDIDGNIYYTVSVAGREWMGSNLKTGSYRTGDPIPFLSDEQKWIYARNGGWSVYNNDPEIMDIYGKLYNWYAVSDERGLCPAGWYVPSDNEWKELEHYLGMRPSSVERTGLRDRYAGGKLKDKGTINWSEPNILATDEFGFRGLPGGYRHSNGQYLNLEENLNMWTSTDHMTYNAFYRNIYHNNAGIYRNIYSKNGGFSVRCIKER
jgi:uncharacterized protein (TIGR02145 family)